MLPILVCLPLLSGLAAFAVGSDGLRRALLVVTALTHCILTGLFWVGPCPPTWGGWLMLDPLGLLFLSITSILFLGASVYAVGYLRREVWGQRPDFEESFLFSNAREATFTGCLLLFLGTMTVVAASRHFGLLWVAVEATTLSSAPLIYFHRHRRSLEATWKYLMICSVGIALALLGNFFLAVASTQGSGEHVPMFMDALIHRAGSLNTTWLRVAFIFLLVGYGTKLGLAPMHTWLPDAHSEAPSVISALLSGALLNCALLGILRIQQVCLAAGDGAFGQGLLLAFGLFSMGVAAIFILRQGDFKRMLAYSSVEHMGIVTLSIGLGGLGNYGAMLHAVNHSLTKGMLFLVAGNVLAAYKTKSTWEIKGLVRMLPVSGVLWVVGFLAITGSPPFGAFLSELIILKAALDQRHIWVAVGYLMFLSIIFIGMASIVLRMSHGAPTGKFLVESNPKTDAAGDLLFRESPLAVVSPMALGALALLMGVFIPPPLQRLLEEAARTLAG